MAASDGDPQHTLDVLAGMVSGLRGAVLVDVGRVLDVVKIGMRRGDEEVMLHVQCPVRILRGDSILLGSDDFLRPHPQAEERGLPADRHETTFDHVAKAMTAEFGDGVPVLEAEMRPGGSFRLVAADEIRIEGFPAVSGPIECWRLFVKGSNVHYVYPPDFR
ncbi:hypothetical protein [Actinoplanes sp. NPDC049118]|uniref:hypothetical protein n=1 Tax=Actinoplanes sp. NPDC049118 TaxID=3155769 RepID=UPI0033E58A5A